MKLYHDLGYIYLKLEDKLIGNNDIIVYLTGGEEHIGSFNFVEYDLDKKKYKNSNNFLKSGHKDDLISHYGSIIISHFLKKNVLFICGIHGKNLLHYQIFLIICASVNLVHQYIRLFQKIIKI